MKRIGYKTIEEAVTATKIIDTFGDECPPNLLKQLKEDATSKRIDALLQV